MYSSNTAAMHAESDVRAPGATMQQAHSAFACMPVPDHNTTDILLSNAGNAALLAGRSERLQVCQVSIFILPLFVQLHVGQIVVKTFAMSYQLHNLHPDRRLARANAESAGQKSTSLRDLSTTLLKSGTLRDHAHVRP